MTIYKGRYRWDGTKTDEFEPIAWSPGAYDIAIYKRPSKGKVELLKPYVCVYKRTGEGQSISANPEKFAKQLCREFSLDLERVLWVEALEAGPVPFEVIVYTRTAKLHQTIFYAVDKRPATAQEIAQLNEELELIAFS